MINRLAIGLGLLIIAGSLGAQGLAPLAKDGRFDLRHWDGQSSLALDGTWLFWWKGQPSETTSQKTEVPSSWQTLTGLSDGWGTYRLEIDLPDPLPSENYQNLSLYAPMINSAASIQWNGRQIWQTGHWDRTAESQIPFRKTGVVALPPRPGVNVLEITVSNFGDVKAGILESLKVGNFAQLSAERNGDISWAVFLFGCLFIMGFYHLGLFFYRTDDWSPLWFALVSLLVGLRGLVYGGGYIADLLPGLGWEVQMKIGYLTFSGGTLFFCFFIRELFQAVVPNWFRLGALAGAGAYSLLILFAPAAWYTPLLTPFQIFVGLIMLLVLYFLIRASIAKLIGGRLFLIGSLLFFATALHDIIKTNYSLPTPFLASVGLLVFVLCQSLVLIRKFVLAFTTAREYAENLTRINSSLERFIPKEVLSFLKKDSIVEIELGDNCEQPMTVMFADIRDFTSLSEAMSPEENFKFINSYLQRVGPLIRRNNGFVDKYFGDGIMALFPGPAQDAVNAALDIRVALAEYNQHRGKSGYTPVRIGIGVHYGLLMLGTIGENQRMDSTVISDTVNAASRLEGLTKQFGHDILMSGETVAALGETAKNYTLEYLDQATVKGRRQALAVYALK